VACVVIVVVVRMGRAGEVAVVGVDWGMGIDVAVLPVVVAWQPNPFEQAEGRSSCMPEVHAWREQPLVEKSGLELVVRLVPALGLLAKVLAQLFPVVAQMSAAAAAAAAAAGGGVAAAVGSAWCPVHCCLSGSAHWSMLRWLRWASEQGLAQLLERQPYCQHQNGQLGPIQGHC